LFVLLNLRAWVVLAFWFASQFYISPGDGIAWLAHVGGFVFGALIAVIARISPGFRRQLWEHKYLTQHPQGRWDDRYGGREILDDDHTQSWHPGP
jgi:membrane associated rhomboid family serine protease